MLSGTLLKMPKKKKTFDLVGWTEDRTRILKKREAFRDRSHQSLLIPFVHSVPFWEGAYEGIRRRGRHQSVPLGQLPMGMYWLD